MRGYSAQWVGQQPVHQVVYSLTPMAALAIDLLVLGGRRHTYLTYLWRPVRRMMISHSGVASGASLQIQSLC